MDTSTFDTITRSLARIRSRRAALGVLAAGLAAVAGPTSQLEAKKKKKPKKVTLCLNGETITVAKKQRNGYIRQGATAGKCAAGSAGCASDAGCNAGARETCQNGVCACPAGFVRDANGICGDPAPCKEDGSVVASSAECCSGHTTTIPTTPPTLQCTVAPGGCLSSANCPIGLICVNGLCATPPE
ncbi:MAG: hypothetical protein QM692_18690 [Thermomicrobiales bacterium]